MDLGSCEVFFLICLKDQRGSHLGGRGLGATRKQGLVVVAGAGEGLATSMRGAGEVRVGENKKGIDDGGRSWCRVGWKRDSLFHGMANLTPLSQSTV